MKKKVYKSLYYDEKDTTIELVEVKEDVKPQEKPKKKTKKEDK